jgi:hypothetical protein
MIKFVYEIDYPLGQKRAYLEWVRSIADVLQEPAELKRLTSYDNAFSASPQRVVEFSFDSMEDGARYFERPEISRIFQGELPGHGVNIRISVLKYLTDYAKGAEPAG